MGSSDKYEEHRRVWGGGLRGISLPGCLGSVTRLRADNDCCFAWEALSVFWGTFGAGLCARFRWHTCSGFLCKLGVEWLCLSKRCTDVAHRHVRMCYGYVLGYALAVEVQNPFTVSLKPGYALRLIDILVVSVCFILCFWFKAFVARLEASQTFLAN